MPGTRSPSCCTTALSASSWTSSCSPTGGRTTLPNFAYGKTPAQIHNMLMWLPATKTAGSARSHAATGSLTPPPTSTARPRRRRAADRRRLRGNERHPAGTGDRYWQEGTRQARRPGPLFQRLRRSRHLLFVGRQVKVFYVPICQRGRSRPCPVPGSAATPATTSASAPCAIRRWPASASSAGIITCRPPPATSGVYR